VLWTSAVDWLPDRQQRRATLPNVASFGLVFALAAILLLVQSLMIRVFDRWFATGCAGMVITS
jgi:hypothetical protein